MPYNRLPFSSEDLAFLENGMYVRLPLSDLYTIGGKLAKLWQELDFSYSIGRDQNKRVILKGQRNLNFFKTNGPFHQLLVANEVPLEDFQSRPSLRDPRLLLVSPRTVLGVIQIAKVYGDALAKALSSEQPLLVCYHWCKGKGDWGGTECPVPYFMRPVALRAAFDRLPADFMFNSTEDEVDEVIKCLNGLQVTIEDGVKLQIHFSTPPPAVGKVLVRVVRDWLRGEDDIRRLLELDSNWLKWVRQSEDLDPAPELDLEEDPTAPGVFTDSKRVNAKRKAETTAENRKKKIKMDRRKKSRQRAAALVLD